MGTLGGVLPETRYAKSGDAHIAYHPELGWEDPGENRFLRRLASFSRLILFDKLGVGLSDRVPVNQLPILEERMNDVRAVMVAGSRIESGDGSVRALMRVPGEWRLFAVGSVAEA